MGRYDFDAGNIHYKDHWKGWALKILTFSGPSGTRFAHCHFSAQKSLDFHGPPLTMPLEMDLPAPKSLNPAPYKDQVH